MEDRLRYTPSDCFRTFPFPSNFETDPALEAAGAAYHAFRAQLMIDRNEGMTKTYNRHVLPLSTKGPASLLLLAQDNRSGQSHCAKPPRTRASVIAAHDFAIASRRSGKSSKSIT